MTERRVVKVTSAQVYAARANVAARERLGEAPPEWVRRVAAVRLRTDPVPVVRRTLRDRLRSALLRP